MDCFVCWLRLMLFRLLGVLAEMVAALLEFVEQLAVLGQKMGLGNINGGPAA